MSPNSTASIAARFSASAATYDGSARVQQAVAERVAALAREAPAPRLVLEVGCGTGLLTAKLLVALPQAKIHAIDISAGMIRQARSRLSSDERVTWIVGDARGFEGGQTYDLIVSSSCLHWILPIEDAFQALHRHLAAGGYLVFGLMQAGTLAELHASRRRVVAAKAPATVLPAEADVLAALGRTGFRVLGHARSSLRVEYPSAEQFLKAVHDQGTTGGNLSRGDRPLTRGEMARLVADYTSHYRSAGTGVRATYEVLYATAQKQGQAG